MRAKPHRKRSGIRLALKPAPKRAKGFNTHITGVVRPSCAEFFVGIDEEEALAVGESLDEREKRG
jgi:hypothetical protein